MGTKSSPSEKSRPLCQGPPACPRAPAHTRDSSTTLLTRWPPLPLSPGKARRRWSRAGSVPTSWFPSRPKEVQARGTPFLALSRSHQLSLRLQETQCSSLGAGVGALPSFQSEPGCEIWAGAEDEEEGGRTVGTKSPSWPSARGQGAGWPGAVTAGTTSRPPAECRAFCMQYSNAEDTL